MMNIPVLHVMTYENGVYTCPYCERIIQMLPDFKILVKGDQAAVHQGSNGGLQIGISVSTATE